MDPGRRAAGAGKLEQVYRAEATRIRAALAARLGDVGLSWRTGTADGLAAGADAAAGGRPESDELRSLIFACCAG